MFELSVGRRWSSDGSVTGWALAFEHFIMAGVIMIVAKIRQLKKRVIPELDDDLAKLWDAPVKTPGLRWGV